MISVCKSVSLEKGTLNLDRCIKPAVKATKKHWLLYYIFLPSLSKFFQRKQLSTPFTLELHISVHNTEDWQSKKSSIPGTAVGLACSGDCLSSQFLKLPIRNGTSTAAFAWGEDKTESTETFFSQIFEKLSRSSTEFQRKLMPKWQVNNSWFGGKFYDRKKSPWRTALCILLPQQLLSWWIQPG